MRLALTLNRYAVQAAILLQIASCALLLMLSGCPSHSAQMNLMEE